MSESTTHQRASVSQRLRRNQRERTRYAEDPTINDTRRNSYEANRHAINDRRRANRRRAEREANQHSRRRALLAARRNRFDPAVFCPADDDISNLEDVMAQRQQALNAARQSMGVDIKNGDPCKHCGAKIFAKESFPSPLSRFRANITGLGGDSLL